MIKILLKKYKKSIISIGLAIIIICMWVEYNNINGAGHVIWHLRVFNHLFVDGDSKFAWVGITSVIAIITFSFNAWDSRHQFKADLISKSRIKWMENVRPLVADYLTDFSKYLYLYYLYASNDSNKVENKELTDRMESLKKNYYQIMLFVPDNETNQLLLEKIRLLWIELDYVVPYFDYGIKYGLFGTESKSDYALAIDEYIPNLINESIRDSSQYFKQEWEQAKQGK